MRRGSVRGPGRRGRCCGGRGGSRDGLRTLGLEQVVDLAAVEPDATALRAVIDLDAAPLRHREGGIAVRALHRECLLSVRLSQTRTARVMVAPWTVRSERSKLDAVADARAQGCLGERRERDADSVQGRFDGVNAVSIVTSLQFGRGAPRSRERVVPRKRPMTQRLAPRCGVGRVGRNILSGTATSEGGRSAFPAADLVA